jgi:hypothetical protein
LRNVRENTEVPGGVAPAWTIPVGAAGGTRPAPPEPPGLASAIETGASIRAAVSTTRSRARAIPPGPSDGIESGERRLRALHKLLIPKLLKACTQLLPRAPCCISSLVPAGLADGLAL